MLPIITEIGFLERLAERFNITAPRFLTTPASYEKVKSTLEEWGGEAIVKPDIIAGKRGKAGAVVKVNNIQDAIKEIKRLSTLEINGKIARTAYLVENIPAQYEIFSAITYNTNYFSPSLTISLEGGIDIESISDKKKITIPVDIYRGLDAYQASEIFSKLGCPKNQISMLSRSMVSFWDLFISVGMLSAEINPWRITKEGKVYACDFKGVIDGSNYKSKIFTIDLPKYHESISPFEDEMTAWDNLSHRGQAHVSELDGSKILPILFGGGASTIIIETLISENGSPMFLSDFGGNPPYERMLGTAKICFKHKLAKSKLLLILGGKANNTFIDVTFKAIADALKQYVEENGPINIPVIVGRGGPYLVKGMLTMKETLEYLGLPYIIFGPDTPVTLVAEYAAKLVNVLN
jgi:succinyl-CoA synthetase beta subunit